MLGVGTLFINSLLLTELCYSKNNVVTGIAFDDNGKFAYCEEVQVDKQTFDIRYTKNQTTFATKTIDNSQSSIFPNINQLDQRDGELRVASVGITNPKTLTFSYQTNKDGEKRTKQFDLSEIDTLDAGFNPYIQEHLPQLIQGETLNVRFGSIAHLDVIDLSLKAVNRDVCLKKKHSPIQPILTSCIQVDIDNLLLKLVIPSLYLGYDTESKLVFYHGTVNINNAKGHSQEVSLHYFYSGSLPTKNLTN